MALNYIRDDISRATGITSMLDRYDPLDGLVRVVASFLDYDQMVQIGCINPISSRVHMLNLRADVVGAIASDMRCSLHQALSRLEDRLRGQVRSLICGFQSGLLRDGEISACFDLVAPRLMGDLQEFIGELSRRRTDGYMPPEYHRADRLRPTGWEHFDFNGPNPAAEKKAKATLLKNLSPAQRDRFDRDQCFDVIVPDRGTFRVNNGTVFNVTHVETGDRYCARPEGNLPVFDVMLGQKLTLETNPDKFFTVANVRRKAVDPRLDSRGPPSSLVGPLFPRAFV